MCPQASGVGRQIPFLLYVLHVLPSPATHCYRGPARAPFRFELYHEGNGASLATVTCEYRT